MAAKNCGINNNTRIAGHKTGNTAGVTINKDKGRRKKINKWRKNKVRIKYEKKKEG